VIVPPTRVTFTLPAGVAVEDLPVSPEVARLLDDSGKVLIETGQVMPTMHALSGGKWQAALASSSQ
jgi:hypothetical protein